MYTYTYIYIYIYIYACIRSIKAAHVKKGAMKAAESWSGPQLPGADGAPGRPCDCYVAIHMLLLLLCCYTYYCWFYP